MEVGRTLNSIIRWLKEPWRILVSPKIGNLSHLVPDRLYLYSQYRVLLGEKPDLRAPRNYNEKLQWLKLHDRKPVYTQWVDKYEVKEYVRRTLGEEYVVPAYGVWDSFDDIDWDCLPERFVLKCTHDSAGLVICRDKATFDKASAREKLTRCMKRNFYYSGREWPYKHIKPRILAEQYLEDTVLGELRDYKFMTFNGVPRVMHLVSNRQNPDEETYGDFFDMEFRHLDLTMGHINAPVCPEKPENFERMKEFAAKLAKDTAHIRVDFYEVDGRLYFGELTFYQDSGYAEVLPPHWSGELGNWIDLKKVRSN